MAIPLLIFAAAILFFGWRHPLAVLVLIIAAYLATAHAAEISVADQNKSRNILWATGEGSKALSCIISHRGASDTLDMCNVPEGGELSALDFMMRHWVDDPWGQDHCVPAVPTGYKCTFKTYSIRTSGFRQN